MRSVVQALDQGTWAQAQRERIGLHFETDGLVVIGGDRFGVARQAVASENSDSSVSMVKSAKDRMRNNISEPRDRARVGRVSP